MASNQYRSFEGQIGVVAGVMAQFKRPINRGGEDSSLEPNDFQPNINQETGIIMLDPEHCYRGIPSRSQVDKRPVVRALTLQVLKHQNADNVLVFQREDGDRYFERGSSPFGDNLLQHSFPPTVINTRPRSEEEREKIGVDNPLAVWCPSNQGTGASNRADVFRVGDGEECNRAELLTLFVVTLDDGQTFRLVGEYGWQGHVYRRQHPAPYRLQTDDVKAQNAFHDSREMQGFLHDYVLVPDEGYGSFELKLQALLVPRLRDKLKQVADQFEVWDESEDFWVKEPPLKVGLREGLAMVQFNRYGMAEGSFGILMLPKPIKVGNRMVDRAQVRHSSFRSCEEDEQGLVQVRPGDIVQYERLIPMDRGDREYAPLAVTVDVLYKYFDPA